MNNSLTKTKIGLAVVGFALFSVIIVGLFWLATGRTESVGLLLAYVAGLSMIFLPCTLPLAFIIVPLTMGQKPKKGLIMAVLFGLGVSITLALYGILTAGLGSYLGLDKATRIMFAIAGSAAFIFGLSELKLLKFAMPGFSGAVPQWIQQKKDYTKIFFMGIFLGNAGVGCPNPAFYVLLTYIASIGSLATGGWLGFVHGVGRATPLIFLAVLGILGVNALGWITKKKASIDKVMGWGLIVVGAFILTYGLFGMPWWEDSIFHSSWNAFVYNIAPQVAESPDHPIAKGFFTSPFWGGWILFLGLITLSLLWAAKKKMVSYAKLSIILGLLLILAVLAVAGVIKAEYKHGIDDINDDIHKEEQSPVPDNHL